MDCTKQERLLSIFFRALRGEDISVQQLAHEYNVSAKSITRDINDLKAFMADHRDIVGNTELSYSHQEKCYRLLMDGFLTNKELLALVKVMIGAKAFSKFELLRMIGKLKSFTTVEERPLLERLVQNEMYYYSEVKHDCESVQDNLWQLAHCIQRGREITIDYYRMDRSNVTRRIKPASVMFADFYFYLIAFPAGQDRESQTPRYYRVDRIRHITIHRKENRPRETPCFNEGELRRRSLYMWPGKLRNIRFEFSGPSVQAVLDKIPTAKIVEYADGKYIIDAEVYGDGIRMWLLSQGRWVKVLKPAEFVEEMRHEVETMLAQYSADPLKEF